MPHILIIIPLIHVPVWQGLIWSVHFHPQMAESTSEMSSWMLSAKSHQWLKVATESHALRFIYYKKHINVESLTHMAYKKCLKKRTLSNKIVWLEIKHWHKHKCENRINWYLHNSVLNSDGHCARICFKIAMVWDFDNNCLTYQWYDDSECVQMYCFFNGPVSL